MTEKYKNGITTKQFFVHELKKQKDEQLQKIVHFGLLLLALVLLLGYVSWRISSEGLKAVPNERIVKRVIKSVNPVALTMKAITPMKMALDSLEKLLFAGFIFLTIFVVISFIMMYLNVLSVARMWDQYLKEHALATVVPVRSDEQTPHHQEG